MEALGARFHALGLADSIVDKMGVCEPVDLAFIEEEDLEAFALNAEQVEKIKALISEAKSFKESWTRNITYRAKASSDQRAERKEPMDAQV